jgi:hypothetical protein
MLYTMRFSLADRPGALGSVATSLSHVPASIVTLRVVEHDGEYAVDEVVVEAEGASPEELRAAAQAIPGVAVECVRRVNKEPDPLAGLVLADQLSRRIGDPIQVLVNGIPDALPAAWAAAFEFDGDVEVIASSPNAPIPAVLETPWLPLEAPRRLIGGEWLPQQWRMSRFELGAVPLGSPTRCLIAGRWPGMRFRPSELRQMEILTGLALRGLASPVP